MADPIPFSRPFLVGREIDFLREAIECGQPSGDGRFMRLCAVTSMPGAAR